MVENELLVDEVFCQPTPFYLNRLILTHFLAAEAANAFGIVKVGRAVFGCNGLGSANGRASPAFNTFIFLDYWTIE